MKFYFDGIQRWDLGLASPNYAGAAVASVLSVIFLIISCSRIKNSSLLISVFIIFVLAYILGKTFSRGGVVAWLITVVALSAITASRRPRDFRGIAVGIASAAVIVGLLAAGFFRRVSPEFLAQDLSTVNRFDLWRYGAAMLAVRPLDGWDWGWSGIQYMNWFQPLVSAATYSGIVSTPLQLAVECGIVAVILWCYPAAFMSVTLFRHYDELVPRYGGGRYLIMAGAAVALTIWVSNLFSTLGDSLLLWILFAGAIGAFLWPTLKLWRTMEFRRSAILALLVAATPCLGLWLSGCLVLSRQAHSVAADSTSVELFRMSNRDAPSYLIILDDHLTGPIGGKLVRNAYEATHASDRWIVRSFPQVGPNYPKALSTIVLFGRSSTSFRSDLRPAKTIIIDPLPTLEGPDVSNATIFLTDRRSSRPINISANSEILELKCDYRSFEGMRAVLEAAFDDAKL